MKQVFTFILIGCIISQSLLRTGLLLHYEWNKAVYLKNCENRDKPSMHCDGKCYLRKKMAATEQGSPKGPKLPEGFHQIKDLRLFLVPLEFFQLSIGTDLPRASIPVYTAEWPADVPLGRLFKPPSA